MAGCVHIPWYATGFRGDALEAALAEIAPLAVRYGATSYHVYRYRDDRYKFLQVATFEDKVDFEHYWGGPEFKRFRAVNSSFFQVPVVYAWADVITTGAMPADPGASATPSGFSTPGDAGDVF
jgi:quinol monooxygenase YgiN